MIALSAIAIVVILAGVATVVSMFFKILSYFSPVSNYPLVI